MATLYDAFAAARAASELEPGAPSEVEPVLTAMLVAGRAAHHGLEVAPESFARHLAALVPRDAAPAPFLSTLQAADLYLACACARGEPAAVQRFEERYLSEVPKWLAHLGETAAFVDEVRQALRAHLLAPRDSEPPRIAEYSGRGGLASWLKVASVRSALTALRDRKHEVPSSERNLEPENAGLDPELAYLRDRYRAEFEESFRTALLSLTPLERSLLRMQLLDGLTVEALAAIHRVNKSTVSRWLQRVRDRIREETLGLLQVRLKVSAHEIDSLFRVVRSQLDVSIASFLRDRG